MSEKMPDCALCSLRPICRNICPEVEAVLALEERHFNGNEVLVSPDVLAVLDAHRRVSRLSELVMEEVRMADLRSIPDLTERQLVILAMTYVKKLPQRTIARRLGLAQSTVGEHLDAARRKIRDFIDARRQRKLFAEITLERRAEFLMSL